MSISTITRTKSRELFLPRVFKSLIKQTYRPIEWIVVNDAGDDISLLIDGFKKEADSEFTIKYIYKESSTTMEEATNLGLENATGVFINILDDDDTVDSKFYEKTIHYLSNSSMVSTKGVISYTEWIYEDIMDNQIIFIERKPFAIKPKSLLLTDILIKNQFPIHSFVYRREVLESIGVYNKAYPVLGDWDFNIRFLAEFDIGIIPEVLVSYHKRIGNIYANTDKTNLDAYSFYEAIIRNNIMRDSTNRSLATLMGECSSSLTINSMNRTVQNREELRNKDRELSKRLDIIVQKSDEIRERDKEVAHQKEDLLKRDAIIVQKSDAIRERDKEIAHQKEDLLKRDAIIVQKSDEIRERDKEIAYQKEDLLKRDEIIIQKSDEIRERDKELRHQKEALIKRDGIIIQKSDEIRKRDKEIQKLQEELFRYNKLQFCLKQKIKTIFKRT